MAKERKLAPHQPEYWANRLFHSAWTEGGIKRETRNWCVRLQHLGRRETVNLAETDRAKASAVARDVYLRLRADGWDAVHAIYKPEKQESQQAPATWTIDAILRAASARSTVKLGTMRTYRDALQTIVAGVAGLPSGRSLGSKALPAWRERVGRQLLSILNPVSIAEWRSVYVKHANPVTAERRTHSAASFIRNARALFKYEGMPESPFKGVKLGKEGGRRYESKIDPRKLMDDGRSELAPNELLALLLLLWGGLRKAEADTLTWDQVYWRGSYIDIRTTPYFSPKTEESKRHIDLDRSILKEILAHKRKGRVFVLPGTKPKPTAGYAHYRCLSLWKRLGAWLRTKGITEVKVIHAIRKEAGSLIVDKFGIEGGRGFLGHKYLQTVSAVYTVKKRRHEVTL